MLPRNILLYTLFSVLALATTAVSHADETPENSLKSTIGELIDILHDKDTALSPEKKRDRVLAILEQSFSFDIIIRRALGRNWEKLSAAQQDNVTILITDLLIRAYTRELQNGPKPVITYLKTEDLSSNKIEIPTQVTYKGTKVAVSYRLANIKSRGWQVYDVLIEGISMVSNYRKQFEEHFQTKSAADLISLLKSKLEEPDA